MKNRQILQRLAQRIERHKKVIREGRTGPLAAWIEELRPCSAWTAWGRKDKGRTRYQK
jgi:hypothetical protein